MHYGNTAALFKRELSRFKKTGYRSFPWRGESDPYHILVSEIMLQQTQTDRVIAYYLRFIKTFPTSTSLSKASLKEVLTLWSGLGYNRRARFLHNAAQKIETDFGGSIPHTYEALRSLPGVGEYTANAVLAFAFNKRVLLLETNIRTVLIHHFFKHTEKVTDQMLKKVLSSLLPKRGINTWYGLLMDYGAALKKEVGNKNKQSTTYKKQKAFKGSEREIRGHIVSWLLKTPSTKAQLANRVKKELGATKEKFSLVFEKLLKEGLLKKKGGRVTL